MCNSMKMEDMAQDVETNGEKINFLRLEPNKTYRIRLIDTPRLKTVPYKLFFSAKDLKHLSKYSPDDPFIIQRFRIVVIDLHDGKKKILDVGKVAMRKIAEEVRMKYLMPKIKIEKGFVFFSFIPNDSIIDITRICAHGDNPRNIRWNVRFRNIRWNVRLRS